MSEGFMFAAVSVMPQSPQDVARAIALIDDGRSLRYAARTISAPYTTVQEAYYGSANAMEVAAAEVIWKRSLQHKFRYTTMVADGDAKTFSNLQKLSVYGPEVIIEKEECLNHVAKRLKTGLKNVVAEWRVKGVTLGDFLIQQLDKGTLLIKEPHYTIAMGVVARGISNPLPVLTSSSTTTCFSTDSSFTIRGTSVVSSGEKMPLNTTETCIDGADDDADTIAVPPAPLINWESMSAAGSMRDENSSIGHN
ncbi:hypothetical protein C0J52_24823 [Blattella germanica]|nr:hypothetical protein C0J52_24823 [Blattella germanica]